MFVLKWSAVCLVAASLLGCSAGITESSNREKRSTVYYGQTTADLFENFGVPTHVYKLPSGVTVYAYHSERVVRDWARQFFYYCDLQFDTVDGHVVAWNSHGNQCALISEADEEAVYGNEFDRFMETNFSDFGYGDYNEPRS